MNSSTGLSLDIELIAQRVLKLAEIATLEHLEALARSQADGLMDLAEEIGTVCPESGLDGFKFRS